MTSAPVIIRGVPVEFPFEPYDLQREYMEKVLDCLQNETNGVLESPTGTGKTLSLLCSSLAWLQLKKAQAQLQSKQLLFENATGESFASSLESELGAKIGKTSRAFLGLPTIIYASRTHSQLSQAMQELKRSSYSHMKACVLGSREQMCIHPEVEKEESGSAKVQQCRIKVKTRTCYFNNRVERMKEDQAICGKSVMDIEDIVTLGREHKFCPYYMSKELKQNADIIFMPYNYLLDARARAALGVELSGNVVILDEAHNIERICEDSASLQLKTGDVALAIEEATALMKMLADDVSYASLSNEPKDFTADELCDLKKVLLDFETVMDGVELNSRSDEGTTFDGNYIYEMFEQAGINDTNFGAVTNLIDKIIQYLTTVNEGPFSRRGAGLELFSDLVRMVFTSSTPAYKDKIKKCYKVHLKLEDQFPFRKKADNWLAKTVSKKAERILSYWCFSPGFGMSMLMDQGIKCIILTSGTLAPLKPLISELELDVPVRLENPHVVTNEQICVKVIPNGPDGEPLICNYQNRDNPKYVSSLGMTILNVCRSVPGGLLIFFPSYPIMLKCQEAWQNSEIWRLVSNIKAIYIEPKDKNAFNTAMRDYYQKIQDPTLKGAIFMGVCRGKVSEGLDFADGNGRAVIIIGLPFPPIKDPRVILKKRYLDICNAKDKEYLNGNDWYTLEATRAVNQAIGRVIRHRYDYGAILLLDNRFTGARIRSKLSMWLRNHIQVDYNFGPVIRGLRQFFSNAQAKFPEPKLKPLREVNVAPPTPFGIFELSKKFENNLNDSSSSSSSSLSGEVKIHKRSRNEELEKLSKRKKIVLIPNKHVPEANPTTTNKEFIIMVKNKLEQPVFRDFIDAMKHYKDTNDFNQLKEMLDKIFIPRTNVRYLILGLEPYIKSNHRGVYSAYCDSMR